MSVVNELISRLDQFIRKFYTNQLIRGLIYTLVLVGTFFLLAAILNYFGQFKSTGRTVLFFTFLAGVLGVIGKNIIVPLLKMLGLLKGLSHEEAALMVGDHFEDVRDKILNTLQLSKANQEVSASQMQLVTASVNQRIKELKPFPFLAAVDFKENKKHLKFLLVPILIFGVVYFSKSEILTEGANRLINYNDEALDAEKIPFAFQVQNEELKVLEQEDFTLQVKVKELEYIPNDVYIQIDGQQFKLKKNSRTEFSYTFRKVQAPQNFTLRADKVASNSYALGVIPKPSLVGFEVKLDYPSYTQLNDETLQNIGDLNLPEGTKVEWSFQTKNTDELEFKLGDSTINLTSKNGTVYLVDQLAIENFDYGLITKNEFTVNKDSIHYYVSVAKDGYPSINVSESQDSTNKLVHYYNGDVADDYGFSKLRFVYNVIDENGERKSSESQNIAVSGTFNKDQFFHYFDITTLNLQPGEKVEYYFQVWDNDGVNGAKSTKSTSKIYKAPTLQELAEQTSKSNDEIKDELEEAKKDSEDLKKDLEEMKKSLLQKENPDWQDKNKLEQFLQNQQSLEQKIEQLKLENQQNQKEQNQFNQKSEEILQKQEMINKLFEELMTDEMKELYKELQEMMQEMNKDQLLNKMEEIEMSQEEIEKELDRTLEQFKQFEVEQKMEDITQQLDELAKKQEELAEETKNKEKSQFELNKEQEEINEEFKKIQEQMDELEELNDELEDKNDLPDTEQDEQDISEDQKESQEKLGEKKNKQASQKQKDAAQKMEEMSQKMKNSMSQSQAQKQQEDMDALRQLLENLIDFSFEQEDVMTSFQGLNKRDPKYVTLGQRQQKLQDDAKLLEDSLFALSKRVLQLSPFINKEVGEMNLNIERSIKNITERRTPQTMANQQYVMTAVNNLALLFDEAMKQMQEQQSQGKPGSGQCNNPGGNGSPGGSPKSMEQLKKQMQKQLEKMKEAAKGKKPGGQKPGDKGQGQKPGGDKPGQGGMGGQGGQNMSEGLAKMAAEQAALRKQISDLSKQLNEDGSGAGNGLKELAKELEELEEEIINGNLSQDVLNRQQDITTRLLEHKDAKREQDFDDQRKSNEAFDQDYSNPTEYLKYKEKKEKELELLKTIPPSLRPYYKNKVNDYFDQIQR